MLLLSVGVLSISSCSKDNPEDDPQQQIPVFKVGDVVTSSLYRNGVVKGYMVATIVNFGTNESPSLFYVNGVHTLDCVQLTDAQSNRPTTGYRSLPRSSLEYFGNVCTAATDIYLVVVSI